MSISPVVKPIHDHVIVTDMNFDEQKTASGIIVNSDNGKSEGIRPRWARVWAIGKEQSDVNVGDWILVEHGRWTRSVEVIDHDGSKIKILRVDTNAIIAVSNFLPSDINIGKSNASTTQEFDFSQPMF